MGINVENKVVSYTDKHQFLVDTSTEKNPFVQSIKGTEVISVFRRRKSDSHQGDGNPLIFALKRMRKYQISTETITEFMPNLRFILNRITAHRTYDLIIALPSSHSIASGLARRVGRALPMVPVSLEFFMKCSNGEVAQALRDKKSNGEIRKHHLGDIASLIHTLSVSADESFKLKEVENHLRGYTFPFKINENLNVQGLAVLVVDDLLSSGTSILTAKRLLVASGADNVSGLCLLSSLDGGRPWETVIGEPK
ncbi:phosphoribosyltransferase [Pseudomonas fildesensis]|uniref:phosphoribosyltransferase n=1 Tax=Pseudomonas fildesensis TaxID=1674920 RepID=UPI00387B65F8